MLLKTQYFSKEEILNYQNEEFVKIAKHAIDTVPFYADWSKQSGFSKGDVRDITDISKFPIITKELVRKNPIYFCSSKLINKKGIFKLSTSGTTGTPLVIYCDKKSRRKHYAFFTRLRSWFGIKLGDRRATFFGRIIVRPDQKKPPFWRYDINQRNMLFSSYHMSQDNLRYYYDKLVKFEPSEIISYPSSIFVMAKYMKENNLDKIKTKIIFTTAETLLDHQRKIIEEQFGCSVIDQYGCTEMSHFVSQCEHETYHVHPEHGIIEVLDNENEPVAVGNLGNAVCTGFVNFTMPILRYKIGDVLILGSDGCKCGRNFPLINQIVGRTDDMLITPDGRPLGRMDPVFKGMGGILETQIIQVAKDRLEINMSVDNGFSERIKGELIREIEKRTGNQMKTQINIVGLIPRDKNGKFKAVISRINNQS